MMYLLVDGIVLKQVKAATNRYALTNGNAVFATKRSNHALNAQIDNSRLLTIKIFMNILPEKMNLVEMW